MIDFINLWTVVSSELEFRTSRSGGPGGQNVNKTETKVEVRWNVWNSRVSNLTKQKFKERLVNRIDTNGVISVVCSEARSQLRNKEIAVKKLQELLALSLVDKKKRKPTKPSKASQRRRIESKKRKGITKNNRRKINPNEY